MTASAFDPLAAVQALEAAGVDRRHAEAHAAQLRAVANADLERLATRADLDSLRRELDSLRREFRYGMGIMSAINLVILGRLFGIL